MVIGSATIVIQVRNEKGEGDWIHRAHIRRLAPRPKHLSHNCYPSPHHHITLTNKIKDHHMQVHPPHKDRHNLLHKSIQQTNTKTQDQFQLGKHADKCQRATMTLQCTCRTEQTHTHTHTHKSERDLGGLCYMSERDL